MASVFEVLDEVRKRPGIYVGGEESQRALQLTNLEQLLSGYAIALRQHGVREPVADFPREFGAFLWKTKQWSASCGPIAAIRRVATNDQDAWDLFWDLVDEFRATVESPKGR